MEHICLFIQVADLEGTVASTGGQTVNAALKIVSERLDGLQDKYDSQIRILEQKLQQLF